MRASCRGVVSAAALERLYLTVVGEPTSRRTMRCQQRALASAPSHSQTRRCATSTCKGPRVLSRRRQRVQSSARNLLTSLSTEMGSAAARCLVGWRPRALFGAGTCRPGGSVQIIWVECTSATNTSPASSSARRKAGGERSGGKRGRGSPGKTPFLAAVETTPEGKPVRLKLHRVTSFCRRAVEGFAKRSLDPACEAVSDRLGCFAAVTEAGCQHTVITTGSGARAARTPAFKWVNTALGNMKAAITGTYRSIAPKHVPRYLAEFEYRFNHRYDLAGMLPRLATAALQTPPMPYRLLKLAEVAA